MTRLLLITLLVLSSGPAYAEWLLVGKGVGSGMTTYADPDTIRREGNLVTLRQLTDFQWMLGYMLGCHRYGPHH